LHVVSHIKVLTPYVPKKTAFIFILLHSELSPVNILSSKRKRGRIQAGQPHLNA